MHGLNTTDGLWVACGASTIDIRDINPPPRIGVILNPALPPAPAPGSPPPPHTEPVFPPPAAQ